MITLASTEWAGVAFFLVPIPVAIALLVFGARKGRADTFLMMMIAVTLLPAIWATAVRAGWGGCDGCLSDHEESLMTAALASVPLLIGAMAMLFTGRVVAGAVLAILAQIAIAIGVWEPNLGLSLLMALIIAGEV